MRHVGLSIGNLTSQWFCNLVLDRLDHHVKEVLRIPGYVRYMDDFVLFADDKPTLRAAHDAVAGFLAGMLRLRCKPTATILAPARHGLPFLGWCLHRGTTRLRPETLRRIRRRVRQRQWQHRLGQFDTDRFAACIRAVAEHMRHGSTLGLRRDLLASLELNGAITRPDATRTEARRMGSGSPAPATA